MYALAAAASLKVAMQREHRHGPCTTQLLAQYSVPAAPPGDEHYSGLTLLLPAQCDVDRTQCLACLLSPSGPAIGDNVTARKTHPAGVRIRSCDVAAGSCPRRSPWPVWPSKTLGWTQFGIT